MLKIPHSVRKIPSTMILPGLSARIQPRNRLLLRQSTPPSSSAPVALDRAKESLGAALLRSGSMILHGMIIPWNIHESWA